MRPFSTGLMERVHQVDARGNHSIFLDVNGCVWSYGSNFYNQLGHGDTTTREQPERVLNCFPEIKSISTGYFCSLFLDIYGTVWISGELKNVINNKGKPKPIENLPEIQEIGAGYDLAIFLDKESRVWFLGFDGDTLHSAPILLPLPEIKSICCRVKNSLFVDKTGIVWGMGSNDNGQLGLRHTNSVYVPTEVAGLPPIDECAVSATFTLHLDFEGDVWSAGMNYPFAPQPMHTTGKTMPAVQIPNLPKIKHIFCGTGQAVMLDYDGGVWTGGWNEYGKIPGCPETGDNRVALTKVKNLPIIGPVHDRRAFTTKKACFS